MSEQVILLLLSLKFEMEQCQGDLGTIQKEVKRYCKRGMHGKRMVAMIIVSEETVAKFGERMQPLLSSLGTIENFWIMAAPQPDDVFGQYGSFDPAVHRIREAWVETRERAQSKNMRESQRIYRFRKHRPKNF